MIVDDNPLLSHVFDIANTTGAVQRFGTVGQSCGCTSAVLSKDVLAPGERTQLAVSAHLSGRIGSQRFVCTLPVEGAETQAYELTTVVLSKRSFSVPTVHFQATDAGERHAQKIEHVYHAPSERELPSEAEAIVGTPHVKASVGPPTTLQLPSGAFSRRFPIEVELTAPAESGTSTLQVRSKGNGTNVSSIGVSWQIVRRIVVTPEQVTLGVGSEGGEKRVTLRRADAAPVNVVKATASHPRLAVSVDAGPIVTTVTIRLTAGEPLPPQVVNVIVETDAPSRARSVFLWSSAERCSVPSGEFR